MRIQEEIEKRQLELAMKKQEMDMKRQEMELKQQEMRIQLEMQKHPFEPGQSIMSKSSPYFDVTKHIKLVPPFQEKEVDQYFLHFEKIATNLNWPKENWSMLLQSVLIGKAREVYTQLSVHQSANYDIVKELILNSYELVPEAYRQKFRNLRI
jgi:hypothetical protein